MHTEKKQKHHISSRILANTSLVKHFHKHAHHVDHIAIHVHHTLLHCGELLFVLLVGLLGILFANFTGSLEALERTSATEIATYLLDAINHPEKILKQGNLISIWKLDGNVENTFTKWYCTYWAARISPEFFPFTDDSGLTQQRSRWGNAVNRCENAATTWYKIGNTPAQWALVVYDAGGRFGPYGHVGKVMHYDRWLQKIIVRDMARVSTFTMSDRREDLTTANVKCYIYNIRNTTSAPLFTGSIPNIATSWTQQTQNWTNTIVQLPISTGIHNVATGSSSLPFTGSATIQTPSTEPAIIVTPPVQPPVIEQEQEITVPNTPNAQSIKLVFDTIQDPLVLHYIWQRDIEATISGKTAMKVGDATTLNITIKDKKTQETIQWLLPITFSLITSNTKITLDYTSIKLMSSDKIEIRIKALDKWKSTVVLHIWDESIGKIHFSID